MDSLLFTKIKILHLILEINTLNPLEKTSVILTVGNLVFVVGGGIADRKASCIEGGNDRGSHLS
jgi:hypothetical protein